MDAERFDRLVESLTRSGTRRGMLRTLSGAILGAAGLGALAGSAAVGKDNGKSKHRREGQRKSKHRNRKGGVRAQAIPASCCSGGACAPGPGKNLGKCCFEDADLVGKNFKGANLGSANFSGAILTDANFSSANLGKTCFVDADITGAKFNGANQGGTIFCRTRTSQGINNSGCAKGNDCCETCVAIGETGCKIGGECCGGAECTGSGDGVCTCPDGLTNCNGKCVELDTDLDNCTECGNACPSLANATVICGAALDENGNAAYGCAFTCGAAFANCIGDPELNGCETPINNDPNNCGGCGNLPGKTCSGTTPRCCGCKCFEPVPPDGLITCAICQPITSARLIRRR